MLADEFFRASVVIFEALTQPADKKTSNGFISEEFRSSVTGLLRSDKGVDAQRLLFDVSTALERRDNLADLKNFLNNSNKHLRFYAFRVLDQHGQAGDAKDVLTNRLLGDDGFVTRANKEFVEIKINVAHIGSGQNQDSNTYWRYRAKQLKYMMIDELKYYAEAARFTIDTSASTFSSSTSGVMNYVLGVKQVVEQQQELLIKAREGSQVLSNSDMESVNDNVLTEFLYDAIDGVNADVFTKRLQGIIDMLPHLKLFEDVYVNLKDASGKVWSEVQKITEAYARDIVEVRDSCQLAVENEFNSMDYTDLPGNPEVEKLVDPYVNTTRAALEAIKVHIESWLHVLSENQKELS